MPAKAAVLVPTPSMEGARKLTSSTYTPGVRYCAMWSPCLSNGNRDGGEKYLSRPERSAQLSGLQRGVCQVAQDIVGVRNPAGWLLENTRVEPRLNRHRGRDLRHRAGGVRADLDAEPH